MTIIVGIVCWAGAQGETWWDVGATIDTRKVLRLASRLAYTPRLVRNPGRDRILTGSSLLPAGGALLYLFLHSVDKSGNDRFDLLIGVRYRREVAAINSVEFDAREGPYDHLGCLQWGQIFNLDIMIFVTVKDLTPYP